MAKKLEKKTVDTTTKIKHRTQETKGGGFPLSILTKRHIAGLLVTAGVIAAALNPASRSWVKQHARADAWSLHELGRAKELPPKSLAQNPHQASKHAAAPSKAPTLVRVVAPTPAQAVAKKPKTHSKAKLDKKIKGKKSVEKAKTQKNKSKTVAKLQNNTKKSPVKVNKKTIAMKSPD